MVECQKIMNLLGNTLNQQRFKFRTRNWMEINDNSWGTYKNG